ncbi:MAG TPA: hypothetical protein PKY56_03750 [Candidatus Kapabacteria bacterium]|nr:hypothetical protein [Candidatus Kapabacteria bacterium]HPO62527.1 hypothetical protein [Candidatus Kapabacteria bacterium]
MKKFLSQSLFVLFIAILLGSCGEKKADVAEIGEKKEYKDPILSFSLNYPGNWVMRKSDGSSFVAYSHAEGEQRFNQLDPEGVPAGKIYVYVRELKDGLTLDSIIKAKKYLPPEQYYSAPENVTIDGTPAIKEKYQFDLGDGKFNGEIYYATKDSVMATIINFEAFAGSYETYKPAFDEVIKSMKLAFKPLQKTTDTTTVVKQLPLPSEKLSNYKTDFFTIMIPDNFDVKSPAPGKNVIKSYQFIGERRADCEIRVDVINPGKQKDLKKIADGFKATYGNSNPASTNFAGKTAYMFQYSPIANVLSQVYVVMNGDKLFRITINRYTAKGMVTIDDKEYDEAKTYETIFKKAIQTFKFN